MVQVRVIEEASDGNERWKRAHGFGSCRLGAKQEEMGARVISLHLQEDGVMNELCDETE